MLGDAAMFSRRLLKWYDRARRDLPWRHDSAAARPIDPYHVLVSEAMLQQTQVATVIPYFNRFIARFGDFTALAAADPQEVLRLWQGLGYYSRARNLHSAARSIVAQHGGRLPADFAQLLALPGVGRYTAGAVASIAFGLRVPILDGNVIRVLCRLDKVQADPRSTATRAYLWRRAEEILPAKRLGDFNSALMELGALICVPRSPNCMLCPVRDHCEANAAGLQDRIPTPRKVKETPLYHRRVFCIRRSECAPSGVSQPHDRWLIEQRPPRGRWAGMWQFITIEGRDKMPSTRRGELPVPFENLHRLGEVKHGLTHRQYHFSIYRCDAKHPAVETETPASAAARRWVTLKEIDAYPVSRPHLKIAEMLRREVGRSCEQ